MMEMITFCSKCTADNNLLAILIYTSAHTCKRQIINLYKCKELLIWI